MIKDATPIVYDMKNNVWTTQFNRIITATVPSGPLSPSAPETKTNIGAIGGGIAGFVIVAAAVVGFIFNRRRSRQARASDDKGGDDTIGRSPREPRKPEERGDLKSEQSDRNTYSSPLNYNNGNSNNDDTVHYAAMARSSPHSPTPSSIGLYAAMRSPESGRAHVPTNPYKAEWTETNSGGHDQSSKPSSPRSPHEFSDNNNNHSVDRSGGSSSSQYSALLNPRNPQTPPDAGETGWVTQSEYLPLRGPQGQQQHQQAPALPVRPGLQSQDYSQYVLVDQSRRQYQDRNRELTMMMENIRAEQEELERTRLEHESQMQAHWDYSQPYYQEPPPSSPM